MSLNESVRKVVNAFSEYTKTGDKSLIEGFSRQEIVAAIGAHQMSWGVLWFKAMEHRIAEIDEKERYIRTRKDRLKDIGIGFLLGIIGTVIGGMILWYVRSE